MPYALRVLMDVVEAALRTGCDADAAVHVAAMQEANLAGIVFAPRTRGRRLRGDGGTR